MHTSGIDIHVDELIATAQAASSIHLLSGRKASSTLAGEKSSKIQGRGMDFHEFREYTSGDDAHRIDWRVTARTGSPHIRLYREERERPVFIIVDQGPSMQFGTRVAFKSVIAARVAAMFAWAAYNNHDRVGGFIFGGNRISESKPKSSKQGIMNFFRTLTQYEKEKPLTQLNQVLSQLQRVVKPGSLLILCSDFYHFDNESKKLLQSLTRSSEMIAVLVRDPLEAKAPKPGTYTFSDGEHYHSLNTSDKKIIDSYEKNYAKKTEEMHVFFQQQGSAFIQLNTNDDIENILQKYFGSNKTRSKRKI